jgi:4a-hydroxytetrahydrobiopterin dehydratase
MSELTSKHCVPCEGGVAPLTREQSSELMKQLHGEWQLNEDNKSIKRSFKFKNFYHTMSFVNAVAHVSNKEDHHPDLEVGYNYCNICYNTHAIGGLSENDFICAAKVDAL